jgi:hypothetical protein
VDNGTEPYLAPTGKAPAVVPPDDPVPPSEPKGAVDVTAGCTYAETAPTVPNDSSQCVDSPGGSGFLGEGRQALPYQVRHHGHGGIEGVLGHLSPLTEIRGPQTRDNNWLSWAWLGYPALKNHVLRMGVGGIGAGREGGGGAVCGCVRAWREDFARMVGTWPLACNSGWVGLPDHSQPHAQWVLLAACASAFH